MMSVYGAASRVSNCPPNRRLAMPLTLHICTTLVVCSDTFANDLRQRWMVRTRVAAVTLFQLQRQTLKLNALHFPFLALVTKETMLVRKACTIRQDLVLVEEEDDPGKTSWEHCCDEDSHSLHNQHICNKY